MPKLSQKELYIARSNLNILLFQKSCSKRHQNCSSDRSTPLLYIFIKTLLLKIYSWGQFVPIYLIPEAKSLKSNIRGAIK